MAENRPQPDDDETSVYPVTAAPAVVEPAIAPLPPVEPPTESAGPAPMPPVGGPLYPSYRPAPYGGARSRTVARVIFAGVVLFLFGLGEALGGAVGAVAASTLRKLFDQLLRNEGVRLEPAALTGVLTAVFVTMLILGIVEMIVAGGVFAHRAWGRWLGVILCLLGTIGGAWLTYRVLLDKGAPVGAFVGPLAILIPYAIALVALLYPGNHFRRVGRSR